MEVFLKNTFLLLISIGASIGIGAINNYMGYDPPSYFEILIFAFVFRIYITSPNDPAK